jgi:methylmalonyl-CoA mutase
MSEKVFVIPPNRTRYLSEISESNRTYDQWVNEQSETVQKLYAVQKTIDAISEEILLPLKKSYRPSSTN